MLDMDTRLLTMNMHIRVANHLFCQMSIHSSLGPDQVMNVRVYVYQPILYSDVITALIVWDPLSPLQAGGVVNRYIVSVSEEMSGEEIDVSVGKPLHACTCMYIIVNLLVIGKLYVYMMNSIHSKGTYVCSIQATLQFTTHTICHPYNLYIAVLYFL